MAVDSKLYWQRVGHVEVENANGRMVSYGGLDFKFKVKACGDIYQDFSVSILGLSAETINDLTVWSPARAIERPRRITVYGGYANSGEELIATGYIWYAIPTNPPDMWMTFECKKYLILETIVRNPRTVSGTRREIFEAVAEECSFRPEYRAIGGDVKGTFEISGKKSLLVAKFSRAFDKATYEDAGTLICIDNGAERKTPERAVRIDSYSGLLSMGNIDNLGARLVTRLRTDLGLYRWVYLNSALIPSASGNYLVVEKELKGHFRGDDWLCEFRCLRKLEA